MNVSEDNYKDNKNSHQLENDVNSQLKEGNDIEFFTKNPSFNNENDVEKENSSKQEEEVNEDEEEIEIPKVITDLSREYNNYEITANTFTKYKFYKKYIQGNTAASGNSK